MVVFSLMTVGTVKPSRFDDIGRCNFRRPATERDDITGFASMLGEKSAGFGGIGLAGSGRRWGCPPRPGIPYCYLGLVGSKGFQNQS